MTRILTVLVLLAQLARLTNLPLIILASAMLMEMMITAINEFIAPYRPGFWYYGTWGSFVFIALFWGFALETRLSRMEQDDTNSSRK